MVNTLHIRRAEKRWSQKTLAMQARIGFDRYFRIEKGYTEPTDQERADIASALDVAVDVAFPPPTEGAAPNASAA